jgi:hypothetical protein
MTKVIKNDDWKRDGAFIKMIMENIQKSSSDQNIINLVKQGMKDDYSQDIKLSESDIFLLYCKLIEAKRTSVVKELRLIEDLVDFEEEYTYATIYREGQYDKPISFPLLAYCVYNQVDWKDIAYIQQHKKIANATSIQIELQKNSWGSQLVKESILDNRPELNEYKPYLRMGDVYVDFMNNQDNWDVNIRSIYEAHPNEVKNYLGYMAEHFTLAINPTPDDESGKDKEWLSNYAKALRNMTEKVIDAIRAKRSLTKEKSHDALCKVSESVLIHLNACDETSLKKLDEKDKDEKDQKAHVKLTNFIEALRKNVKKISSTYSRLDFFNTVSSSSAENQQLSEIVQLKQTP